MDVGTEVAVAVGAVVAVAVGAAVEVAVAAVVLVAVAAVFAVTAGVIAVTATPPLWFTGGDWPDDWVVEDVGWVVVVAAAVDAVAVW
ncbi:MAG TPA: hypothetical protein VFL91_02340 [Thermomicrobiales bacterium]|nr:hypothetical protein [Thermomicrobiales bacterium]